MRTLGDIALLVDGELQGDPSIVVSGVAALEDAKEGDLAFVLEINKLLAAEASGASALVVPKEVGSSKKPLIRVDHTRMALAKILAQFSPVEEVSPGVHPSAVVGKDVKLGKRVLIYPLVYIGDNCEIGDDTIIHPNTTLYPRTRIGKRCIIHSGCVIGIDGFGFVQVGGKFIKVPQIGRVVIEDDVEIYANNCIARGAIGATTIKRGTKIDNLNHVAHNVVIGQDCAITSHNVFGGSSSVGNRVQISGQCGVAPHVHVGDDSILMGRAGVTKNIPPKSVLLGYPAQDHAKEHRLLALIRRLPELFERIKKLEKE